MVTSVTIWGEGGEFQKQIQKLVGFGHQWSLKGGISGNNGPPLDLSLDTSLLSCDILIVRLKTSRACVLMGPTGMIKEDFVFSPCYIQRKTLNSHHGPLNSSWLCTHSTQLVGSRKKKGGGGGGGGGGGAEPHLDCLAPMKYYMYLRLWPPTDRGCSLQFWRCESMRMV